MQIFATVPQQTIWMILNGVKCQFSDETGITLVMPRGDNGVILSECKDACGDGRWGLEAEYLCSGENARHHQQSSQDDGKGLAGRALNLLKAANRVMRLWMSTAPDITTTSS
ncbi:hypothetical protein BaRGS_00008176 [Batillaria attramentaria]|uniref:Uncharacterized protein n=1 Tax=Batillaria attramentaria TaxID=370345 RepID=A0ABD0LMY4_9CAEN